MMPQRLLAQYSHIATDPVPERLRVINSEIDHKGDGRRMNTFVYDLKFMRIIDLDLPVAPLAQLVIYIFTDRIRFVWIVASSLDQTV